MAGRQERIILSNNLLYLSLLSKCHCHLKPDLITVENYHYFLQINELLFLIIHTKDELTSSKNRLSKFAM